MRDVLIVGGGASGILVATQIAMQADSPTSVRIAEPAAVLGAGLAYGTSDEDHLLNVPAGRMSALVTEPKHLCAWADCGEGEFISRRKYGRYLLETFLQAQGRASLASFVHERTRVQRIRRVENQFHVTSETGPLGKFDAVVLACGHSYSKTPSIAEGIRESLLYVNDPWRDRIPKIDGTLLAVGTGLTFIDLALSYLRRNESNEVIGISRTGELPMAHLPVRAAPLPVPQSARQSPQELLSYIDSASDWRAAQDGVRHELPEIWHSWSEEQKNEFWTAHLRWWNVRRHRIAPEIAEELQRFMEQRRLRVARPGGGRLRVQESRLAIELQGMGEVQGDLAVNATGYGSFEESELFASLFHEGLVVAGPLGMGIRSNFPALEVTGANGLVVPGLFGIGPVFLGERFETTAIPELREQAVDVVRLLLRSG